jgi:uncharacterized protein (DUF1800 family)
MMFKRLHQRLLTTALASSLLILGGCFEVAPPSTPPAPETAARFLGMTTFGATPADIDHLVSVGYEAWLAEQFAAQPIDSHLAYADRGGPPDCIFCPGDSIGVVQDSFWYQAINGPDQLRQRVTLAWLELFVASAATDGTLELESLALGGYLDTLSKNAFGNFRDLLEAVTLSPAMGHYLSHMQNDKEDPVTGRLPDENYAREVMQLFTIGKWQLNLDGTRSKDANGNDIPTYTQKDVMGLAKALTGWSWGGPDTSEARWVGGPINNVYVHDWSVPMQPYEQHHSALETTILNGVTIPASTTARDSLKIALDTLYNHPNVAPMVATHLIKRLTTSNPSPGYVGRVANIFNSNAHGERGNLQSVIRAVLFDPEVWDGTQLSNPNWGKPKEPIVKAGTFIRALSCKASNGVYLMRGLRNNDFDLGQPPLQSNSVFNYFQGDHAPQGELADSGLTAPEYQITNNNTFIGFLNFVQMLMDFGLTTDAYSLRCDYSSLTPFASDASTLVDKVTARFMGSPLDAPSRQTLIDGINSIPFDNTTQSKESRVKAALMMMAATPEFNVQR